MAVKKATKRDITDLVLLSLAGFIPGTLFIFTLAFFLFLDLENQESASPEAGQSESVVSANAAAIATLNAAPRRVSQTAAVLPTFNYHESTVTFGEREYLGICAACHGTDARGISGLGKGLANSKYVRERTDQEVLDFVIVGRTIWDEANTTGVAMPARGGNPGLSDESILSIIAYVRTLDESSIVNLFPDGETLPPNEIVAVPSTDTATEPTTDTAPPDSTETVPSEPVVFTPIELGGGSDDTAAPVGRVAEELYTGFCEADDAGRRICEFLVTGIGDQSISYEKVIDLLTNGSSPFDSSIPSDVVIPQRGSFLFFTDGEIQNLAVYLFTQAGVEPPVEAQTTATEPESAPAVVDRTAEEVYTALCEVDDARRQMCAFLVEMIAVQTFDRAKVVDLLTFGSSPFDISIPDDIVIPQRGDTLLLKDTEIQNLTDYLFSLAAAQPAEASFNPPDTESTAMVNGISEVTPLPSYTSQLKGSIINPPRKVADFTLPSTKGTFTFSEQRGKILMVYFGYLTCPDVCPTTMADMMRAYRFVGEPQNEVVVALITLDPERDTLERLDQYVSAFNADFIGLRPESAEQVQALVESFGVTYQRREVDSELGYLIDHSATVFLVGPDGRIVSQFPFGIAYTEIANDLEVMANYTLEQDEASVEIAASTQPVDPAREYRIVIPQGTGDAISMGNDPGIIPLKIELTLGERDILVLENHDHNDFLVGGIWVAPYETVSKQFYEPQSFVGLCTVTVGRDLIEIIVSEPQS